MPFSQDPVSRDRANPDLEVLILKEVVKSLADERKARKIPLRELSKLTGYGFGYHAKVERGEGEPGMVALLKWAKALNLNLAEILIRAEKKLPK